MKIRVLGAGFYGSHIGLALKRAGMDVQIHEIAPHIFAGASGSIPARLHIGCHYPRSRLTRAACLDHRADFMASYGFLTRAVPVNLYTIAADHSLVDFDQYVATLRNEIEFLTVHDPAEFGLQNVEGAIQVAERHIVTGMARAYFETELGDVVRCNTAPGDVDSSEWDYTIDCTFCANDSAGVDRYEPCLVVLLEKQVYEWPVDTAITIMDGPFPSLYPWDEGKQLCSLSSAKWTPFSKTCKTWAEARELLDGLTAADIKAQGREMIKSMGHFYPDINSGGLWLPKDYLTSIRAMPLSGADTRLVDVVRVGERALRVRAGKIDAIIAAEKMIRELMG